MHKKPSKASPELIEATMPQVFAPWVQQLGLELREAHDGEAVFELPVAAQHVHGGGVLCGQTMMAAADSAMVMAIMTSLGEFRPMTTVQLQTSFIRPIAGDSGHATVTARVLKLGRTLVFGEIQIHDARGALAAHATTTYALL